MEINLDRKRLDVTFLLCLTATLFIPVIQPSFRLQFFSSFLIIAYYKKSFVHCLWLSLICGFIIDLLASQPRIGMHALDYCLTTLALYNQRKNFFADSLTTLPLMTFFFSVLSTLIFVFLGYMMELNINLYWSWVLTDLLILPAGDGFAAFLFFIVPPLLIGKKPKKGKDYFLLR